MGCDLRRSYWRRCLPISIHYPHGVRHVFQHFDIATVVFQSTHPHGVRQRCASACGRSGHISIHAPAWGATGPDLFSPDITLISIHAPAWGATQSGDHRGQRRTISIHAPAWGATGGRAILRFNGEHFNPRTRMGCDRQSREHRAQPIYFNPRTRMGCDSIGKGVGSLTAAISIHAPGWGATIGTSPSSGRSSIFQSTHPGGVRPDKIAPYAVQISFQSTHPGGVRPGCASRVGG